MASALCYNTAMLAEQNTIKTAASRLRLLLNSGQLPPAVVTRLRSLGMLPGRKQYADGFRRGIQERLQKAFNRADRAFSGGMGVKNISRGSSHASYTVSYGADKRGLKPFDGRYELYLPDSLGHTQVRGANFDTSRMPLHDAVTALHEILEHRGALKNGMGLRRTHPLSRYVTNLTHMQGVLSGERRAYELLVRQLGGRTPNWGRFRLSNNALDTHRRSQFPDEMVRSTFTGRDERDLRRLLARMESVRLPRESIIRGTYGTTVANPNVAAALNQDTFADHALTTAGRLADRMRKPKLKEYFDAYRKTINDILGGHLPGANKDALGDAYLWHKSRPRDIWEEYLRRGRGQ